MLQYIDAKDVSDIVKGIKISFQITGSLIYGKEHENDNTIFLQPLDTSTDAILTLYDLEDKLIKEERFERISKNTARRNNMFDIMIKA